jgi:hydroxyacylglutathione hydrolase
MAALDIAAVPAFADNYLWLVHDEAGGETAVVDPGDAAPVLAESKRLGWTIGQVWNTHWHPDHTGGNAAIKAATGARVTGPAAEAAKIAALDASVGEGDALRLGDHVATVMATPAHTAGHVSYHFAEHGVIFVGDTLFAMGCGRLFEGSAEQMFAAMQRYAALPGGTQVYCGHAYTQANGRYALAAEPGNAAIVARMAEVDARRRRGDATVPTTIAEERATNPFMRSRSAEELARRRIEKDTFAG